jgi:hypothetical protein
MEYTSHPLRGGSFKSRILIVTVFHFHILLYLGLCVISTQSTLDIKFYNRRTLKSYSTMLTSYEHMTTISQGYQD